MLSGVDVRLEFQPVEEHSELELQVSCLFQEVELGELGVLLAHIAKHVIIKIKIAVRFDLAPDWRFNPLRRSLLSHV